MALIHRCFRQTFRGIRVSSQVTSRFFSTGEKRYTKEHEWLQLGKDQVGTVGISNYAQEALGDVVFVDLPEVGSSFKKGESFGSVESVKAASSVYLPVDGKILERNEKLTSDHTLVNKSAEADGWMVKIKVADTTQLEGLLKPADYKNYLAELKKKDDAQ